MKCMEHFENNNFFCWKTVSFKNTTRLGAPEINYVRNCFISILTVEPTC